MRDRDHVDREVMSVLDGVRRHPLAPNYGRWDRPILTPRAAAVLAAVEEAMGERCEDCADKPWCPEETLGCPLMYIRAAWRTP
jgi:hypothetical protein